jgi:hypothetical protein
MSESARPSGAGRDSERTYTGGFVETSRGCGKRVVVRSARPVVGRGRTLQPCEGFPGHPLPEAGWGETWQRVDDRGRRPVVSRQGPGSLPGPGSGPGSARPGSV